MHFWFVVPHAVPHHGRPTFAVLRSYRGTIILHFRFTAVRILFLPLPFFIPVLLRGLLLPFLPTVPLIHSTVTRSSTTHYRFLTGGKHFLVSLFC